MLLVKNIGTLFFHQAGSGRLRKGADMRVVETIHNAWLAAENGRIVGGGGMDNCPANADEIIDAEGGFVLPTWCDSHTHIVFAASRENEFVDRINGLSYEEIAERGGGILNSAARLQQTSQDDLFQSALARLHEIRAMGTGAVEIKSGYGLSLDAELKMLRVIKSLKQHTDLDIKATFLGAHAIPTSYKPRREEYIKLIVDEMLPQVAAEQLADYCDVFCDRGFFTVEETDTILTAAAALGLKAKIHANELDYSGGVQIGTKHQAISVDHLECVGDAEIEALKASNTIPTLLPSTAFFLGIPYAPARKIIDAGLPVSLATDYNPGSSPSGKMAFILSLACIQMKMLPEEALVAATVNAAHAMELQESHGSLEVGKKASFIITKPVSSLAWLPYAFGSDWIKQVVIQ